MVTEIQQTIINKLLQVPDMTKLMAKMIFNLIPTGQGEEEFLKYMEKNPEATIAQLDEKAEELCEKMTPERKPKEIHF